MKVIFLLLPLACFADSTWVRLRSPHFELLSSAGPSRGREVLGQLEQIRHVFSTATGRKDLTPLPVRVFVFGTETEYAPFRATDSAAGYYQSAPDRDYIVMQVGHRELYRVVFHEYTHLLLHHTAGPLPVWFSEGTAEVYSTASVGSNEVRIGDRIPVHLETLRREGVMDVQTLLAVTRDSPWYNERDKTGKFYAGSWALVHMLTIAPEYRPGMPAFLARLYAGEDPALAMTLTWNKTLRAIGSDLGAYIAGNRYGSFRLPTTKPDAIAKPITESLSDAGAQMMLVDLLLALHRPDTAEAFLLASKQSGPVVEAALGDIAVQRKEDEKAIAYYESAMRMGSSSWRVRYDYAMLLRERNPADRRIVPALQEALRLEPSAREPKILLESMLQRESRAVTGERRPKPDTPSVSVQRTEGLLTQIDCLGSRARLHLSAQAGKRLFLLVENPGGVTLRNAGGAWTEFSCGPLQAARKVLVEYQPKGNETYGTSGEVAAIEFR